MMRPRTFIVLLCLMVQAACGRAYAGDVGHIMRDDLASAQKMLMEQRERVAEERMNLTRQYETLQEEVRVLRDQWRDVQRLKDSRLSERAQMRRQGEQAAAEQRAVWSMLTEYRRASDAVMSPVQRQRYQQLLKEIDQALADDESSGVTLHAVHPVLSLLRALVTTDLPTAPHDGFVIDSAGLVLRGQMISAGPVHFFLGGPDGPVGYVPGDGDSEYPFLMVPPSASFQRTLIDWAAGRSDGAPLDVTGEALLKWNRAHTSFMERLQQGGLVMIPLGMIGVLCLVLAIQRYGAIRRMDVDIQGPLSDILQYLHANDARAARLVAESTRQPWRDVLLDGIAHWGVERTYMEEILQDRIIMQAPRVTQYLGALAICAAAAPLLGLLGTVTGMIHTFQLITVFGTGDARSLSGGISEALITTQAGLVIAVPVLLAHAYLSRKARGVMAGLSQAAVRFVREMHPGDAAP